MKALHRTKWFWSSLVLLAIGVGVRFAGTPSFFGASAFSGERAKEHVAKQVSFGPRVPGTDAHARAAQWIFETLKSFKGLDARIQSATVDAPNGTRVTLKNIIASSDPANPRRVLLSAHWDTRPWTDQDPDRQDEPGPGANDGGSGVGVLMELARVVAERSGKGNPLNVGVDFILWDLEDMGLPSQSMTYCLGSQYWAKNPHRKDYKAMYAINLDMVGDASAEFPREGYSRHSAPDVMEKIRSTAKELGFQRYFPDRDADPIIDDHYIVSQMAGIPAVDLIHLREPYGFPETWHTKKDTVENISPDTLEAVGRVLLRVLEKE